MSGPIEAVVGEMLASNSLTIALAESCTGGQVMKLLSDVPGSSRYLLGGIVAYSNEVKIKLLGVPGEIIDQYGAVSEETAISMASAIKELTSSSVGIGITGIAGPDGGTPLKPTGLVYIALAVDNDMVCRKFIFPGGRQEVRTGATCAALDMIRRCLLGW